MTAHARLGLAVLLAGCAGKSADTGTPTTASGTAPGGTTTGSPTGTGTGPTPTGTTTPTGTNTGTTGTTPTGTAPLTVTGATAQCGYATYGAPSSLSATAGAAAGTVDVVHTAFASGCCPNFSVQARVDFDAGEIQAVYDTQPDPCDCICMLDATYQLGAVPSGSWTLTAAGDSAVVVVP